MLQIMYVGTVQNFGVISGKYNIVGIFASGNYYSEMD
jgi:hypothetical protein